MTKLPDNVNDSRESSKKYAKDQRREPDSPGAGRSVPGNKIKAQFKKEHDRNFASGGPAVERHGPRFKGGVAKSAPRNSKRGG